MYKQQILSPRQSLEQWLIRAVLLLLASATIILLIGQYTNLDLAIADYYFDAQSKSFPWDHTWFGRDFMHGYIKNVLTWTGYLIIGACLLDFVFRFPILSSLQRTRLRVLALSATLEPLLVITLKKNSSMHCPWGVDLYGGSNPFLRLLDAVPDGWQAGHCFPAGHASSAMWLCALAVLWLPTNPKRALMGFIGGISAGMTLGWVQQMRGQHFLTHTLWTVWLASALTITLIALFSRQLCGQPKLKTVGDLGLGRMPSANIIPRARRRDCVNALRATTAV